MRMPLPLPSYQGNYCIYPAAIGCATASIALEAGKIGRDGGEGMGGRKATAWLLLWRRASPPHQIHNRWGCVFPM
jgi:hypothetical protein